MQKNKSFTLIEILIVVGILMVLSAATIPSFVNYSSERSIDRYVQSLVNEIQLVRNKALSGAYEQSGSVDSTRWLIMFRCDGSNNNRYRLGYSNNDGNARRLLSDIFRFPTGYNVVDIPGVNDCITYTSMSGTWNMFLFDRLTGELFNPVDATEQSRSLRVSYSGATRTIKVYRSGQITVSNP